MIERKNVIPAMIIVLITISILHFSYMFLGDNTSVSVLSGYTTKGSGTLQVQVVNGWTNAPLKGATVVIPEISKSYTTDSEGKTPVITVPIIEDDVYKNILEKTWGEITLLVYNDGYIPYALFHVMVTANENRNGPTIMLFETGSTSSSEPFCIIEGPEKTWANQLINKYTPKN